MFSSSVLSSSLSLFLHLLNRQSQSAEINHDQRQHSTKSNDNGTFFAEFRWLTELAFFFDALLPTPFFATGVSRDEFEFCQCSLRGDFISDNSCTLTSFNVTARLGVLGAIFTFPDGPFGNTNMPFSAPVIIARPNWNRFSAVSSTPYLSSAN